MMTPSVFFTFQVTLLFGPPSVPRSDSKPLRHSAACRVWSPASLESPATQVWLLMLFPPLLVPPSPGRFETWYCVFATACGPCACAGVKAAPQEAAAKIIKRLWLVVLVMC